jgi:hypothetical protein
MLKMSELLADPGRWCQGASAIDAEGLAMIPMDPRAVRWCLIGAAEYCNRNDTRAYLSALKHLAQLLPSECGFSGFDEAITAFNDNPFTTHSAVAASTENG